MLLPRHSAFIHPLHPIRPIHPARIHVTRTTRVKSYDIYQLMLLPSVQYSFTHSPSSHSPHPLSSHSQVVCKVMCESNNLSKKSKKSNNSKFRFNSPPPSSFAESGAKKRSERFPLFDIAPNMNDSPLPYFKGQPPRPHSFPFRFPFPFPFPFPFLR
jgi:hypothetical protein